MGTECLTLLVAAEHAHQHIAVGQVAYFRGSATAARRVMGPQGFTTFSYDPLLELALDGGNHVVVASFEEIGAALRTVGARRTDVDMARRSRTGDGPYSGDGEEGAGTETF